MFKILPSSDVRSNFSDVLKDLASSGTPCFVTQNGRATAVMLSVEQYEALLSELEDKLDEQDPELARDLDGAQAEIDKGQYTIL